MSNQELFDRRINGKLPVLVDFYTNQDATSRTMHTLLKIVAYRLEGEIKVISVNIDTNNNQEIVEQYLQERIPVFILFQGGEIKWQAAGFFTSRKLVEVIERFISPESRLKLE